MNSERKRAEFKGTWDKMEDVFRQLENWLLENNLGYKDVDIDYPPDPDPNTLILVVIERKTSK